MIDADTLPMTPGSYLQKRRMAADVTVEDVAKLLASNPVEAGKLADLIDDLEGDETVHAQDAADLIRRLHLARAFAFDATIYFALVGLLADTGLPCPQICRVCACSWMDPCIDGGPGSTTPCSWAEPDLCSRCARTVAEARR
jgi:hypothetical protein